MKRGFTLIELLAVIVILAIIALIAIPTISGLIEKARLGSARSSALGWIDAVDKQIAVNQLDEKYTQINPGTYNAPFTDEYGVKVKGNQPTGGWVEVTEKGTNSFSLVIENKYVVSYFGDEVIVEKGNKARSNTPEYVYFNNVGYYEINSSLNTYNDLLTKTNMDLKLIPDSNWKYYVKLKLNSSGEVTNTYVCGVKDNKEFCLIPLIHLNNLDGFASTSTDEYRQNATVLQETFPSCQIGPYGCTDGEIVAGSSGYEFVGIGSHAGSGGVSIGCNIQMYGNTDVTYISCRGAE